jgi:thymidylate kinase
MKTVDIHILQQSFAAMKSPFLLNKAPETTGVKLYYRNNPDGTVRWIWPSTCSQPLFLKFYNTANRRAKLLSGLIRLVFLLRIQKLFASGTIDVWFEQEHWFHFRQQLTTGWCFFTGTPGVHRTAIFYGNHFFYKLAIGNEAEALMRTEYHHLNSMQDISFEHIILPTAHKEDGVLKQGDIAGNGKRIPLLTTLHWKGLQELTGLHNEYLTLRMLPAWQELDTRLKQLQEHPDPRIPGSLVKRLQQLKASLPEESMIPTSLAHGDFTPWNMFVTETKISLIDWELASDKMPCLFDAFHFIYQQSTLADRCGNAALQQKIQEAFTHPVAKEMIQQFGIDTAIHHRLYLLFTATKYLIAYSSQTEWQPQISWSIDSWHIAAGFLLHQQQPTDQRTFLLADIFSFLQFKEYAALKWLYPNPANLPVNADIDLCINKKDSVALKIFLQQHPFAEKINTTRRSFMRNDAVLLKDGSFLSIDTIWQFKRKSLVMMDALPLINSASVNAYGVRIPCAAENFRYTWLFYLLNDAAIPAKYQQHFSMLSKGEKEILNALVQQYTLPAISDYQKLYHFSWDIKKTMERHLMSLKENRGGSRLNNKVNYIADTFRQWFTQKGFTITFSGVDGAGKSTVIENIKVQIEKKYRRRVVVLRHRPSILPMISAWKEGREAAEKRAAATLPRQGNNSSIISSLLRFGYYYTDYLIGQFIVYFKYIRRGYIVLYDRYYFDFINDGKRSNINLSPSFIRLFYRFLLKPQFNFFLYANAATILRRKKELDGTTISNLTKRYLQLFKQLDKGSRKARYIVIENIQLAHTLQIIDNNVKMAAV